MTPQDHARDYGDWLAAFLPDDYERNYFAYRDDLRLRRAFQAASFEAGWLVPGWPPELGGRGLDPFATIAVKVEGARRKVPRLPSVQSVGVVAPALHRFGTDEQRAALLPATLRGELTWALGMSEPEAGSDLASLRMRADAVDGGYRVNGQKIWTTLADTSDWAMLYCRTDRDAPRHRGISCLLLRLHEAEGVTIRPIETGWPGTEGFCEVFLDDTFVPASGVLGGLGEGWTVAMSALAHERDMIWINAYVDIERVLQRAAPAAAAAGRTDLCIEFGRLATDAAALQHTGMRALAASIRGLPNPEFSILKLLGTEAVQRACDLGVACAGPAGLSDAELLLEDFDALGATIFGGTSEIQRNVIGERVLGLPRG